MTSTRDLLLAVQSGKSTVIQATFDAVITEKTTAAIEAYREAVIDNTFNTVHESEEDQSIEKAVKRLANGTKLSEEISELSKKTLRSYIKNAKSDIRAKNKIVKSVEKLGPDRATAYDFHNMQNAEYKVLDRKDGVSKATHRLTKESEDFDLSEFTLEEIQEFMESEDFSTLDELSKKTLASYVKKSSSNAADLATNAMHLKNIANTHDQAARNADQRGDYKTAGEHDAKSDEYHNDSTNTTNKVIKRLVGVRKATDKLAKG